MFFHKKERYMIVGLGNPGAQYEKTRHNAGFLALDVLEKAFSAGAPQTRRTAKIRRAVWQGKELFFVRPITFMNRSGEAVSEIGGYFKIPKERLIVISDDVSMDPGRLRIRFSGSDGGHNGLKDIIRALGSQEFTRIKIGVGQKPRADYDLADWVLSRMPKEDLEKIKPVLADLPGAIELLLNNEPEKAQNQYNR